MVRNNMWRETTYYAHTSQYLTVCVSVGTNKKDVRGVSTPAGV